MHLTCNQNIIGSIPIGDSMTTIKKGMLTRSLEWCKHLRPEGRRHFWKGERAAEKREIKRQLKDEQVQSSKI